MRYYAVDRLEGDRALLVGDDGAEVSVARARLPRGLTEGSVLRVSMGTLGKPDWITAVLDEAEQGRRLQGAREELDRLKRDDPGGDVTIS